MNRFFMRHSEKKRTQIRLRPPVFNNVYKLSSCSLTLAPIAKGKFRLRELNYQINNRGSGRCQDPRR